MNKRRDTGSISTYFFPALTIAIAAVGCAGQTPAAHDARAAGEWTFRLPETSSPYAGLAIANPGQPTGGLNAVDDALAKTEVAATPKARPVTQPRTIVAKNTTQPAAAPAPQPTAATPTPSAPAVASAQPEQLALNTPPVPETREEMRYSEREQQSQKQSNFRGGDAVVISASALVIILLIVVLILLLT